MRVRAAVRSGELPTAHDISEGGLACALAECCVAGGLGAVVSLSDTSAPQPLDAQLFGEGPGGVIVAGPPDVIETLDAAVVIGEVRGERLEIDGALSVPVAELRTAYEDAIPAALAG